MGGSGMPPSFAPHSALAIPDPPSHPPTAHLHAHGLIHADFKPLNVVRMPDGTWRLIDLDGAVKIGAPIGAKDLSTAFMPQETTYLLPFPFRSFLSPPCL